MLELFKTEGGGFMGKKKTVWLASVCGFDGAQRGVRRVVWYGGRVHRSSNLCRSLVLCRTQDKVRRRSSLAAVLFMTKEGRRRSSILRGGGKIAPGD